MVHMIVVYLFKQCTHGRKYTGKSQQETAHTTHKVLVRLYASNQMYSREDIGAYIQAVTYAVENILVQLYKELCIW